MKTKIIEAKLPTLPQFIFLGKLYKGTPCAKTFTNRTQAAAAAVAAGEGWKVFKPIWSRPWYVVRET